jgi:metal-sulfur cluster biosynthetic enzyme|tara:strand:- start:5619 stop:5990 length:372 start_codon:yes stop_codon:yes gene_type:complete
MTAAADKLKLLREKIEREKGVALPIDRQHIINNLKEVYDPEMDGVNVYDLGLIYSVDTDEEEGVVDITHTLTSAFCPYADEIVHAIHKAGEVENVESVNVITTFDPPFTMDMVPEETKLMLGW